MPRLSWTGVAHSELQNLLLCRSRIHAGSGGCNSHLLQPTIKIQEGEENLQEGACVAKKGPFCRRKEMWLSICPKIEGVEPLSKFPALLGEAGRLIQADFRDGNMDWKPLPSCYWCSQP